MAKAKTKTKAAKKEKLLDKAELFAQSYIQNMGNATAAAKEVFGIEDDNTAAVRGSEYVRNSKVQEFVAQFMDERRAAFKKFIEQNESHLSAVMRRLLRKLEEDDLSVSDIERIGILVARFAGVELSEHVKIKQIEAKVTGEVARARAEIPGLPPPGVQPGSPTVNNDNRKTLFLLNPPPIPPGGVPTPALLQQWGEMYNQLGFKPGLDLPVPDGDNTNHADDRADRSSGSGE